MPGGRGPDGGDQWGGPAQENSGRALPSLIQDSELYLGEKLGAGSFGVVRKGEWHTPTGRVVRDRFYTVYPSLLDAVHTSYLYAQ